jgi:hypothetical protein
MVLHAVPSVGNRSIEISLISNLIEKRLCELIEKYLVIPNMDDFIVPIMSRYTNDNDYKHI